MGIGALSDLLGAASGVADEGVPASTQRKIEIDGTELPEDIDALVESVTVIDRLRMPDSFVLVIRDYAHRILEKAGIEIAARVKISATEPGGKEHVTLFYGEVTSIEAEYDVLGMRAVVRGFNPLHRLAAGRKTKVFTNCTFADVAKEIGDEAGMDVEVDESGGTLEHVIQANVSDLDFLYQLCARVGFDVTVNDDEVLVFKKPGDSKEAPEPEDTETLKPTQLVWNRNLVEFRGRVSAVAQVTKVNVRGWDVKDKKAVIGEAESETTSAEVRLSPVELAEAVSGQAMVVVDRPVDDQGAADDLAKAIADHVASSAYEATAVAVGSPALTAGTAVSIAEVDKTLTGKWVITTARHEFGSNGPYRTHLEFSGRQDRSLHGLVAGGLASPAARTTIPGIVIGIVEDNNDPDKLGRVKVRYPWLADDAISGWARVATFGARKDQGMIWIPQKDDEVVVAFQHGDINHPIVVGSLWNGKDKPPEKMMEFDNGKVKKTGIVSPGSHKIMTYDTPDDAGIMLITADNGYRLLLSQSDKRVKLHSEGKLQLYSAGDLEIKVDGAIKMEAGKTVDIKANANMTIKGAKVAIN